MIWDKKKKEHTAHHLIPSKLLFPNQEFQWVTHDRQRRETVPSSCFENTSITKKPDVLNSATHTKKNKIKQISVRCLVDWIMSALGKYYILFTVIYELPWFEYCAEFWIDFMVSGTKIMRIIVPSYSDNTLGKFMWSFNSRCSISFICWTLNTELWLQITLNAFIIFRAAHYLAFELIHMRCVNETMVNYGQSGCMLPISSLSVVRARQRATIHRYDCLIRTIRRACDCEWRTKWCNHFSTPPKAENHITYKR